MPSRSAIKAGEAYVRVFLDKTDTERGLKQLQASLNKFARTTKAVGLSLSAIGGAALFGFSRAVRAANEIELTGRRLNAVFKEGADDAREFAKVLAKEIGASRFEIERSLTTFQAFATGVGFAGKQSTKLAQDLTILSRDFAAFQGLDEGESLQRFISALSGSPEVLDRFGINLKAAAIDAQFAAKGIDETTESASEFQKVLARYDIILKTLQEQGAVGKARQELDKFNGRFQQAKAAALDFLVAVGEPLLAALKPVIIAFTTITKALTLFAETFPLVSVAAGGLAVAVTALGGALLLVSAVAAVLSFTLSGLKKAAKLAGYELDDLRLKAKGLYQTSRILNESLIKTAIATRFGSKGAAKYALVAGKLATGFGYVVAAVKAILSPVGLVIVAVGALLTVLGLLVRRLAQIAGFFIGNLVRPIVDFFKGIVASIKRFASTLAEAFKAGAKSFEPLQNALQTLSDIWKPIVRDFKLGLKEVAEFISPLTDFLGLTGKTKIEIAAEGSTGPQLTPEEAAAEQEELARKRKELTERIRDLEIAGIKDTTARALAEIEERYRREIALAEGNEEQIALLRKAKAQEEFNLRNSLVDAYYKRLQSLDDQIAREEAQSIKNEFARRRQEAELLLDQGLKAAGDIESEKEKQYELYQKRLTNIELDRLRAVSDFEESLDRDIEDAKAAGIKTRLELELDAIKRKYDEEVKEAVRLGTTLEKVAEAKREREERAFRKEEERRRKEQERLDTERLDANEALEREIERLDVDLGEGTDLEKAIEKLELDRLDALLDSKADPEKVNEAFDKRIELLKQQDAARKLDDSRNVFGTFSAQQLGAQLRGGAVDRNREEELLIKQLFEAERTNRTLEEIRKGQGATA